MLYLGIRTNALSGGIVVLDEEQNIVFMECMPHISHVEHNIPALIKMMRRLFEGIDSDYFRCIIEKPVLNLEAGKRKSYYAGFSYGLLQGVIASHGISFEAVLPQQWQADMFGNVKGKGFEAMDVATAQYCLKKYPQIEFKEPNAKNMHKGLVIATCLANYCFKKNRTEAINYG